MHSHPLAPPGHREGAACGPLVASRICCCCCILNRTSSSTCESILASASVIGARPGPVGNGSAVVSEGERGRSCRRLSSRWVPFSLTSGQRWCFLPKPSTRCFLTCLVCQLLKDVLRDTDERQTRNTQGEAWEGPEHRSFWSWGVSTYHSVSVHQSGSSPPTLTPHYYWKIYGAFLPPQAGSIINSI